MIDRTTAPPGYPVIEDDLAALGFAPLSIELRRTIAFPTGLGCEWNTIGVVPDGPGHYLFTVESSDDIRVAYAGKTGHLWMVTKGFARGRGSRPGERYGRPIHAGENRRRINFLV